MTVAKRIWFKSLIERLISSGLSKSQIADKLRISPQRLTNILNGSDSISDKVVDSFVSTFNLGKVSLVTQNEPIVSAGSPTEEREETILDRLEYYLLLCGVSEEQAVVNARLDADTLKKVREEKKDLTSKEARLFLKVFTDLNEEWLLSGKGNMYNGNTLPIENRRQPIARILELLNEEGITLEEFAKAANTKPSVFNSVIKWPYDSRSLILGNDKEILLWVDAFCNIFPKYSKFWILTGKTSKYNYPVQEKNKA